MDNSKMTYEEISKKFDDVQEMLESLQDSNANFIFVGDQGNHFVVGGNSLRIEAQILFAMMRYPIVRDIIKTCATRFDELNKDFGAGARNVKMDHLIEKDSESKEN